MDHRDVLLIGNGVNNVDQKRDWLGLIKEVIRFAGGEGTITVDDKPFPLLYEEIVGHAHRTSGPAETAIKRFIADRVDVLTPNDVHKALVMLPCRHILTTNYDHALERTIDAGAKTKAWENQGVVSEALFSLFRVHEVGGKRVWPIHGSAGDPRTIALGYEHYSGYLQRMRNYCVTGTGNAYKQEFAPLLKRLKNGPVGESSWVDLAFTHDMHIIGLTLDFIEMHLWWLLTFRARMLRKNRYGISNRIRYYIASAHKVKAKNRLDLLKSLGVECVDFEYDRSQKADSYLKLIARLGQG